MSLPGGVSTCTVTFGVGVTYRGVPADSIEGVLTADRDIVHAATGIGIYSTADSLTGEAGYLSFVVPHVDQGGFIDSGGNAVTGWYYTLNATIRFGGERRQVRKRFQVVIGQTNVDLDLVPDGPIIPGVTAPTAQVTSVAGESGMVTAEQLAEALEGAGLAGLSADDIAAQLPDTETPIGAAASSTFAPGGTAGNLGLVQADAAYATRAQVLRPITGGNHGAPLQVVSLATAGTWRTPYVVAASGGNLVLEYLHHYQITASPFGDSEPAGTVTFNAAVEIAGTIYRVTFGGRTTGTLDPGGVLRSDPVGVDVTVGQTIFVRTYLATGTAYGNRTNFATSSGRYPNDLAGGGGFTGGSDLTAPGSAAIADSETNMWAPIVYGDTSSRMPHLVGSGDSIMAGQGDSNDTGGYINVSNAGGWFERAFNALRPVVNISKASEKASQFVVTANHRRRARYIRPGAWTIAAYGRNDIPDTTAAIKTALSQHWALIVARGSKCAATTVTPETTSTDNWATTANQTPTDAGRETRRIEVNTWLRAGAPLVAGTPVAVGTGGAVTCDVYDATGATKVFTGTGGHPVSFVIDTANAVESALNSGVWKAPGFTYDGLHPLAPGHIAMAGAVPVTQFV